MSSGPVLAGWVSGAGIDRQCQALVDLGISAAAMLCTNIFIDGVAFLIPALGEQRGIGLAEAGLLSSMPNFGMVATLIAWGYLRDVRRADRAHVGPDVDRRGGLGTQNIVERLVVAAAQPVVPVGDLSVRADPSPVGGAGRSEPR